MIRPAFFSLVTLCALAAPAMAQQPAPQPQQAPPQFPRVAPSSRATVEVMFTHRLIGDRWLGTGSTGGPIRFAIDYGQPHLRGRRLGSPDLVPMDSVWRLGANLATTMTTDVDLTIGDKLVPRGVYTLFVLPSRTVSCSSGAPTTTPRRTSRASTCAPARWRSRWSRSRSSSCRTRR